MSEKAGKQKDNKDRRVRVESEESIIEINKDFRAILCRDGIYELTKRTKYTDGSVEFIKAGKYFATLDGLCRCVKNEIVKVKARKLSAKDKGIIISLEKLIDLHKEATEEIVKFFE